MYTNNNVHIKQTIENDLQNKSNYPSAIPITKPIENIINNDRNIYNSYHNNNMNLFTSIDLNTSKESVDLSNVSHPDGLKTPPPKYRSKEDKYNQLLSPKYINTKKNNSLIFTCRDCNNIYTPDPYDKGSMGYYRCESCRETFVERSCCASCSIS